MKNKINIKVFSLIYWSIILFIAFHLLNNGTITINDKVTSFNLSSLENIALYLLALFVFIIFSVLIFFPLSALYFSEVFSIFYKKNILNKKLLDETDFINNKYYYRDIINGYSPGILNYIDNFFIDHKTVVATIIYLELKGLVKKNDKLELTDKNPCDLDMNSTYIYNLIKENNLKDISYNHLYELVSNDCIKMNLLEEKTYVVKKKRKFFVFISILTILYLIFTQVLPRVNNNSVILQIIINAFSTFMIIVIAFTPLLIIGFIMFLKKINNTELLFVRRKEAKIINNKLKGLRGFITDFSNLDERAKKELILWEDYLMYSVLFNNNNKIIDEYMDLF